MQTLLLQIVFNQWTTAIVMQQWMLTTTLLSDQTTNHRFNVFVKCWSSAPMACVPHPQKVVLCLQQLGLWDHNYLYHASWKMLINVKKFITPILVYKIKYLSKCQYLNFQFSNLIELMAYMHKMSKTYNNMFHESKICSLTMFTVNSLHTWWNLNATYTL